MAVSKRAAGLCEDSGEEFDRSAALCGLFAVTLEILGLVLNPFNRTRQPMRMLLV
jgi:hypothetical protein